MGEMASALAHELNQPLAAISNYMKGSRRLLAGSADPNTPKIESALDRGYVGTEHGQRGGLCGDSGGLRRLVGGPAPRDDPHTHDGDDAAHNQL